VGDPSESAELGTAGTYIKEPEGDGHEQQELLQDIVGGGHCGDGVFGTDVWVQEIQEVEEQAVY
jgi:hypothetical protein